MTTNTDQQPRTPLPAPAASTLAGMQATTKPILAAPHAAASEPTQSIVLHAPHDPVPVEITKSPTDYTGIGISIAASLVVALVTSLIGLRSIRMQLQRQSKDVQAQQRANTKAQLRLDAYKDIQAALTKYSDVESPFVRIALIRAELTGAIEAAKQGRQGPLRARFPQFAEKIDAFQNSLCELVFCLERYDSILPGFDIFKTALSCALHDLRQRRGAFDAVLLNWLPMDGKDHSGRSALLNAKVVTQETVDQFNKASLPLETAIRQAGGWVFDLGVEAQNFSLAEYADKVVPRRKPTDPNFFTVTIDPAERQELQAKFDATEYGRWLAASLTYADRRYAMKSDIPTAK
jgi:hypothetical protein